MNLMVNLPKNTQVAVFIFVFVFFVLISAFFHFNYPKEGDPDIFYHFKHAEIYAEKGIFYDQFPWLPYSLIGKNNSDQWYGFHLFLIPFTYFQDKIFGLKLAGVFITTAFLLIFYFALRILKTGRGLFWTLFMFFSVPPVTSHFLLIRPHVLSSGISALLFAILVSGYNNLAVFLASFFLVFLHTNLFWLPLLILGIYFLVELPQYKSTFKKLASGVGGVIAGLLLMPNPIETFMTNVTVLFGEPLAKFYGIKLAIGTEMLPLEWRDLWIFSLFLLLFITSFFLTQDLLKKGRIAGAEKKQIFASAILSVLFFLMMFALVRRFNGLLIVFGTIFIALVVSRFSNYVSLKKESRVAVNAFSAVLIFAILITSAFVYSIQIESGWDAADFKGASDWLRANSNEGEVVWNSAWDYFPPLFFWNSKNKYTSGTDLFIFYAYNKELYQASEELKSGRADNIKNSLKRLNSRFIVLTQNEPELFKRLLHDNDFEKGYSDRHLAVFRLKTN